MAMLSLFLRVPCYSEIHKIGQDQVRGTMLPLYSLRISAIGMKFSGMMHNTMKQIAT